MNPELEEIKERVTESIHISRIPKQTKTEFIQLAKEEFCEDYGMCLKFLLDFRSGLLSNPNEELSAKIDILAEKIQQIEAKISGGISSQKEIKLISGKKLKRRNEENGKLEK